MVEYAIAGIGATFAGPAGVLISLSIEKVVSDLTQVTFYYNMFSIFTILLLSVVSSQRDTRFMAFLIPIWAGFCMFAGWLKYSDMGTGFGVIVVCSMLAVMNYMQETRHEKFGIGGPGNTIVKIFTFLIVLQCSVVFVNSANIFPGVTPIAESNSQYSNIDLKSEINTASGTGGLLQPIQDLSSVLTQIAVSAVSLLAKCLVSIALFSVIIAQVFPWVVQAGAVGVAFLVLIQFAIWLMYVIFIITTFYRPGPDPGW